MASEKKVILIFTPCDGTAIMNADTPSLSKLMRKGAYFSHVKKGGDSKMMAGAGAEKGQTLWEAAAENGFTVAGIDQEFDLAVLDAENSIPAVEELLTRVFEVAPRNSLVVLVADGGIAFYGMGIAKGKVDATEICPCCVAPTVAYVADFPVPTECRGAVAYAALKDVNFKMTEIRKLQESIVNMEAAMERQSRKPWDKHDCA